jgi:hypothetical protein
VAFKVMATEPTRYFVTPATTTIGPRRAVVVEIFMPDGGSSLAGSLEALFLLQTLSQMQGLWGKRQKKTLEWTFVHPLSIDLCQTSLTFSLLLLCGSFEN